MNLDEEAIRYVQELWYETHLRPASFEGISCRLMDQGKTQLIPDPELRAVHADSILELSDLQDEARFEAALGAALIEDFEIRLRRGEVKENRPRKVDLPGLPDHLRNFPVGVDILALLAGYHAPIPPPTALLVDPNQHLAGHRVLSLWFAAQLIDSAMFRIVAAMDRLSILLWTAHGLELPADQHGRTQYPTFTKGRLERIAGAAKDDSMKSLIEIAENPVFLSVKNLRDHFTHRRRALFEGHGTTRVGYPDVAVDPGSSDSHRAFFLAAFNVLFRPSVGHVIYILQSLSSSRSEP